jgi:osmotically-inducible protein OsmY
MGWVEKLKVFLISLPVALVAARSEAAEPPAGAALPDASVQAAVEAELIERPQVPFDRLDVVVERGLVTLSGRTRDILARDEALTAAASVRGVRAVIDKITVQPVPVSDEQLRSDVVSALAADPAADAYELDVSVKDGVVTLRGRVHSWAEHKLAARVAKGIAGVRAVSNSIAIDWQAPRTDGEIAADVRGLLAADANVDSGLVNVAVVDGVVTLSGVVGSALERGHAIADAFVNGVKRVEADGLDVRWWQRTEMTASKRKQTPKAAAALARTIENKWQRDPYLARANADASVARGGVATLAGAVGSLAAKRQAEWLAGTTLGITRVRNHLKVRPSPPVSDEEIAAQVRQALRRDPIVNSYELWTNVHEGVVRLLGNVDLQLERRRAEEVAAAIKGVVDVHNLLQIKRPPAAPTARDADLREEIRQGLFWSPFVDADDVKVSVRSGVATLSGAVDSLAERRAAENNAHEAGARAVKNQLRVRGEF